MMTDNDVKVRFQGDTAEHQMTILHDEGLYRSVRFAKPDTGQYAYTLTTWPGHLCISGDMGATVFSRLSDMFEFFRARTINAPYWAEKVVAGQQIQAYSEDVFRASVLDHAKDVADIFETDRAKTEFLDAVKRDILSSHDLGDERIARDLLDEFEWNNTRFTDTWEWDFTAYTYRFLWQLHAIRTGVQEYWEATHA